MVDFISSLSSHRAAQDLGHCQAFRDWLIEQVVLLCQLEMAERKLCANRSAPNPSQGSPTAYTVYKIN